jgi:hypothetical protein
MQKRENPSQSEIASLEASIERVQQELDQARADIPEEWDAKRKQYLELAKVEKIARGKYRRNADEAYEPLKNLRSLLTDPDSLIGLDSVYEGLEQAIRDGAPEETMALIKQRESQLSEVEGVSHIKSPLSKARRALKGDSIDRNKAVALLQESKSLLATEIEWRTEAKEKLLPGLNTYNNLILDNIGLRQQIKLPKHRATAVASCLSNHKDISSHF